MFRVDFLTASSCSLKPPEKPTPHPYGDVRPHTATGINRIDCMDINRMKSQFEDTPVSVYFENRTAQRLYLVWRNHNGQRITKYIVPPAQNIRFQTYFSHPWIIADSRGYCVEGFIPDDTRAELIYKDTMF
jgi:hypothetical protein